jgi:general nucleoside transport system permease protein
MSELFQEAVIISILAGAFRVMTPILFAAIGELVTQRAGIWNMGVEGTMIMGAFTSYMVATATGSLHLAVLAGILSGMIMGLITAFMIATVRVDHFITGLGLNLLVGGLTLFWFRLYTGGGYAPTFTSLENFPIPVLNSIPILGDIFFNQKFLTYVAFLSVPVIWYFLYRTRWGLEIRCLGENPKALDIKGLNVVFRQYVAILIGSSFTGLGGAFLMLAFSDRFQPDLTAGKGWLAIVAIIAGKWLPKGVFIAVLVFALLGSVAVHVQILDIDVPYQIFLALPYLASIILLIGLRKKINQPAKLGVPYFR